MADKAKHQHRDNQAELVDAVQRLIAAETRSNADVLAYETLSGGCINLARCFQMENGNRYFVKSNRDIPGIFQAESDGLRAIAATESFRVPEVIGLGETESGTQFLVLEFICPSSSPPENFGRQFGRQLAQLHRANHQETRFGFPDDNFIGSTAQKNAWHQDWVEFFAVQRLGFQLKLANKKGLATPELNRMCDKLILRLDRFISSSTDSTALIHGDLWSGNYLVSSDGAPVLIDPATYFGNRESEFGMTKLFGGFNPEFYHAYNDAYPLTEGWEQRVEIYQLYHLLNHLNIFGTSYISACLQILRKLH